MLNLSPVSTSKTRAVDSRNKGTLNPSCSRLFMKLTKIRRKKRKHRTNYHFTGHNYKPTFPRKQKKLQIEHFIDLQHCLPIFLLCKIAEGRTLCFIFQRLAINCVADICCLRTAFARQTRELKLLLRMLECGYHF